MTTEKVLRKSWDIFTKNWQFLALVSLIVFAISMVLVAIMTPSALGGMFGILAANTSQSVSLSSLFTAAGLASLGFGAIISLLVAPILTGGSVYAGKLALEGKTFSPVQPFQLALAQYGTFLLLTIVLGIALGIGFMFFIIPGIILAVLLGLAPIIVAFEGANVSDALQKSWAIGLKHFWTILLVGVIVGAVQFVLSMVFGTVPLLGTFVSALIATYGAVTMAVIYTETK